MALAKEDIEEIRNLIIMVISEQESDLGSNNVRYELEIRERIVRLSVLKKN